MALPDVTRLLARHSDEPVRARFLLRCGLHDERALLRLDLARRDYHACIDENRLLLDTLHGLQLGCLCRQTQCHFALV